MPVEPQIMTNSTTPSDKWFQDAAAAQIHMEQLKSVERFNGRGHARFCHRSDYEGLTGQGIIHQIGLAPWWMAMQRAARPCCFLRLILTPCWLVLMDQSGQHLHDVLGFELRAAASDWLPAAERDDQPDPKQAPAAA